MKPFSRSQFHSLDLARPRNSAIADWLLRFNVAGLETTQSETIEKVCATPVFNADLAVAIYACVPTKVKT